MAEKLALSATAAAGGAAGYGWLATANDLVTLGVTLVALAGGIAALLYHIERYRKLRKQRKENE